MSPLSKKIQIIALSLGFMTNVTFAMNAKKLPEFRTTLRDQPLYNRIPEKFINRSLIYYRSLLQQEDGFSCGIRMMFQIFALEVAAQREAIEGIRLESTLSYLLQNKKLLSKIKSRIQKSVEPGYDISQGIYDYDLYETVYTKLPHLMDKFLTIYLINNSDEITTYDLPKHHNETYYDMCIDENLVPLSQSQVLKDLIGKLEKPSDAVHFACLTSDHWFSATIKINKNSKAQLLIFNSTNSDLDRNKNTYLIVDQLLQQVAAINALNR